MDGKKIGIIIGVVIIVAVLVFFILGFLRKGPGERPAQASIINPSTVVVR